MSGNSDASRGPATVRWRDLHLRFEFVAFLYAAAIHLLIHHASTAQLRIDQALLVSFVVLYFLADWLARFRLPAKTEDEPRAGSFSGEIWKLFCEVFGLTFLTLAALEVIHRITAGGAAHDQRLEYFFAFFVLATFGWNLLVLGNMTKADWGPLVLATLAGTATDLPGEAKYLEGFKRYRQRLAEPGSASRLAFWPPLRDAFRVSLGEVVAQLLVFHISLSHLAVFLILVLSSLMHRADGMLESLGAWVLRQAGSDMIFASASAVLIVLFALALSTIMAATRIAWGLGLVLALGAAAWSMCPWLGIAQEFFRVVVVVAALLLGLATSVQALGLQNTQTAGSGVSTPAPWARCVASLILVGGTLASYMAVSTVVLVGAFALQQFAAGLLLQLLVSGDTTA